MTTLRFKWSIQYNHKILSPSGCVVWVIFESSSDRSSSPIARSASTVALRLGLGDSVPRDFSYTPCSVMSMSKGGLVPQLGWSWCVWQRATGPTPPSRSPKRRLFASTNLAAKFPGMPGAPYTDKTGVEREIGFGGFEHLAAPSSPSRQRRGLSGRSHLSSKQMPKSGRERIP